MKRIAMTFKFLPAVSRALRTRAKAQRRSMTAVLESLVLDEPPIARLSARTAELWRLHIASVRRRSKKGAGR